MKSSSQSQNLALTVFCVPSSLVTVLCAPSNTRDFLMCVEFARDYLVCAEFARDCLMCVKFARDCLMCAEFARQVMSSLGSGRAGQTARGACPAQHPKWTDLYQNPQDVNLRIVRERNKENTKRLF